MNTIIKQISTKRVRSGPSGTRETRYVQLPDGWAAGYRYVTVNPGLGGTLVLTPIPEADVREARKAARREANARRARERYR